MNNVYTYMGWKLITATDSLQYKLRAEAGEKYDSEGFARIRGYYVIAVTETIGSIGDYFHFTLADGTILPCIVGDIKSRSDSNWRPYGHFYEPNSLSVIEFVVDYNTWYSNGHGSHANPGTSSCHPGWAGLIQKYEKIGNFWGDNPPSVSDGTYRDGISYANGSAGVGFVKGKRLIGNVVHDVFFMGSKQADGYVYFNDDRFYRIHYGDGWLQTLADDRHSWVGSNDIFDLKIHSFEVDGLLGLLFGAGAWSPSGGGTGGHGVESALKWIVGIASDNSHGYSQDVRWGPDYDCSSLMYEGFRVGGGFDLPVHEGYTGTMIRDFTNVGFKWHPGIGNSASQLQRGDILLQLYPGHTEAYLGNNQNVGAHANERGEAHGSIPGDQTGNEISVTGYYIPDTGPWDGVLRYGS